MDYSEYEQQYWQKYREVPPVGPDGMVMRTVEDELTGRRMFEYMLPTGSTHKSWMDPYKSPTHLQLGVNKDGVDKDVFEQRCKRRFAERQAVDQQIARSGVDSLPPFSIANARAALGSDGYVLHGGGKGQ